MAGIVRRLDELGRIVIPKEMRRTMRLNVGDEMEISSNGETLSLKRAGGLLSNINMLKALARELACATEADVCIVDCNSVIVSEGQCKKRYANAKLSSNLIEVVRSRKVDILHGDIMKNALEKVECSGCYLVVEPIVVGGDLLGGILLFLNCLPSDVARAYLHFCTTLICAVLE